MPEIALLLPGDLYGDTADRAAFRGAIEVIVAEEMSCNDNSGKRLELDPKKDVIGFVDLFEEYDPGSGPTVFMVITVINYEDRMRNLRIRLLAIAGRVQQLLPVGRKVVSVRPVIVEEDHWITMGEPSLV